MLGRGVDFKKKELVKEMCVQIMNLILQQCIDRCVGHNRETWIELVSFFVVVICSQCFFHLIKKS